MNYQAILTEPSGYAAVIIWVTTDRTVDYLIYNDDNVDRVINILETLFQSGQRHTFG